MVRKFGEQERTADPIDHASDTAQVFLEKDIANARAGVAPEKDARFDGKHCVEEDCLAEIPAARLAMGRVRCVDCQKLKEERTRRQP